MLDIDTGANLTRRIVRSISVHVRDGISSGTARVRNVHAGPGAAVVGGAGVL
jgi:hypothetical protein